MFVVADDEEVRGYDRPDGARMTASRGEVPEDVVAAVISLVGGTIMLFLVALIAGASFTVIAQRRLPQLGMLSAVGATEHLRLTMLASGAIAAAGRARSRGRHRRLARPRTSDGARRGVPHRPLRHPVVARRGRHGARRRRRDRGGVVAGSHDVAYPASARPVGSPAAPAGPPSLGPGRDGRPRRRCHLPPSAAAARDDEVSTGDLALLALGTVGLIAGVLLVGPIAVGAVARVAGRVPFGPRVALRDLGRYQARSAAAVAAIGLALGIPVTIVAASAAGANASGPGNLGPNQLLVGRDEARWSVHPGGGLAAPGRRRRARVLVPVGL